MRQGKGEGMNALDFGDYFKAERERLAAELSEACGGQAWISPELSLRDMQTMVAGEIEYIRRTLPPGRGGSCEPRASLPSAPDPAGRK